MPATPRTICPECRLEALAESARYIRGLEAEILRLAAVNERQGMRNLLAAVQQPEPTASKWRDAMLLFAGLGLALMLEALVIGLLGWGKV